MDSSEIESSERTFFYRARDAKGRLVRGEISAGDKRAAKKKLSAGGIIVLGIKESRWRQALITLDSKIFHPIRSDDMMAFNRQLQIVYAVGVPIIRGMQMISQQTQNPTLKKGLAAMALDIAEGSALHAAMIKQKEIFDPVYVNLIRVGELTGDLGTMLERASQLIEQKADQGRKVKSAVFYPKIVLFVLGTVVLVVVGFVLPRLKAFFSGFGTDLPPITRFVMGVSDFFVDRWYLLSAIAGLAFWFTRRILAVPRCRLAWDQALLRVPILGQLIAEIEINTFCAILSTLLKSGVPVVEAFKHVQASIGNAVIRREVGICATHIEGGGSLAGGLESAHTFPPMVRGLIAIGEEGGRVPDVLERIARHFRVEIDYKLGNLSKLIEPLLLFFIFGCVLVLALAVFLPMWKMSSVLKHR